jgi:hypothetical protein
MHNIEHQLPPQLQDTEAYIIAHMSRPEIEQLSKIQGGMLKDPSTGYPSFLPLGEVMGHKRFVPYLENFKRDYLAKNTNSQNGLEQAIRRSGRYGDTEAVILPRHVADVFDNLLYGGKQPGNPHTGKREYFLGNFLGSLGKAFSPLTNFLSPVINGIGGAVNSVGQALSPVMNGIGSAVNSVGQALSPVMNGIGSAFQSAAPAIGQFASPLLSQGVSRLGQKAGLSPETSQNIGNTFGQTASNLLSTYGQNANQSQQQGAEGGAGMGQQQPQNSYLDILKQGAGNLLQKQMPSIADTVQNKVSGLADRIKPGMGNVAGQFAGNLTNSLGNTAASNLSAGVNPTAEGMGSSAINSIMGTARQNLPNISNPMLRAGGEGLLNAGGNYMGGASPLDALKQGVSDISPENMMGAQNYASSGISSLLDSILPEAEAALPEAEAALPLIAAL